MPFTWILFVVVSNAAVFALAVYLFGQRERDDGTRRLPKGGAEDPRQTLASLHQLTCEVTHRVERHVDRLDTVVRKLASKAAGALHNADDSEDSPLAVLRELKELAGFLRASTGRYREIQSQLETGGGDARDVHGTGKPEATIDSQTVEVRVIAAQVKSLQDGSPRERRRDRRESTALPLTVMPLCDNMLPFGREFEAVAREISTGGMSFSHAAPLNAPYVAVVMTPPDMQEICVVVERRHTSRVGPFFITGGDFVCRLQDGPALQLVQDEVALRQAERQCEPVDVKG